MKTSKMLVILLVLGLVASGCTGQTQTVSTVETITGSGSMTSETREVGAFHGIELLGSGDATITVGDTYSLTIEAEDNILPYLTSEVENGVLVLGTRNNVSLISREGWRYTITVESLDQLNLAGSGDAVVTGLSGEDFTAAIYGTGSITVSGAVDAQTVTINGSGAYEGYNLESSRAVVQINGSGSVYVTVADQLEAQVLGSGDVRYAGAPTVTEDIQGSGSVQIR